MKAALCFLVCVFVTTSLAQYGLKNFKHLGDDSQTLQLLFNGFFEQAGLADPTTVVACFDSDSATLTVTFIGTILQQLANNNIKGAEASATTYGQQLPDAVKTCLAQNAEIQQAAQAYHLTGMTIQQIQSKVEKYAFAHFFALHHDAVIANSHFQSGEYPQVGQEGGQIIQQIFGKSEELLVVSDPNSLDILQQYFDGFFEEGGLPDPTTLVSSCFDESSAQLMDSSIATIVDQLANNKILAAESTALNLIKQLPPSVQPCVTSNPEFIEAAKAYGVADLTPTQVVAKVVVYAVTHMQQLNAYNVACDQAIKAGNYTQAGQIIGESLLAIFNSSNSNVVVQINDISISSFNDDYMRDLHELLAGFWEQVSLPDPTTPINCFDESSAKVALDLFGQLLKDMANDEFLGFKKTFAAFAKELPQNVTKCFLTDSQVAQVEATYGIAGLFPESFEQMVGKYAISHYLEFHHETTELNQGFQTHKYQSVGFGAGQALQKMLKN